LSHNVLRIFCLFFQVFVIVVKLCHLFIDIAQLLFDVVEDGVLVSLLGDRFEHPVAQVACLQRTLQLVFEFFPELLLLLFRLALLFYLYQCSLSLFFNCHDGRFTRGYRFLGQPRNSVRVLVARHAVWVSQVVSDQITRVGQLVLEQRRDLLRKVVENTLKLLVFHQHLRPLDLVVFKD